jgi:LmbE family N-acetylglucosaminyl deacetylase
MNNKFISNIVKKRTPCYFISPHLDDAALSCGSLMVHLAKTNKVTVVNVFTKAHSGPYTFSAKKFLEYSGNYNNAVKLFRDRKKEDNIALSRLGIKTINLDFEDALFRRHKAPGLLGKLLPEIDHAYPTYKWHIIKNKIFSKDDTQGRLGKKLKKLIAENSIVFTPYNIASHIDHHIVRSACEMEFSTTSLYSDFPYNIRHSNYGKTPKGFRKYEITPDIKAKSKLIQKYKTQFVGLFPDKLLPPHKEIYFIKQPK